MPLKDFFKRTLLKLPEGNPPIPHGDPSEVETWNPDQAYLRYRLLGLVLSAIPGLIFALGMIVAGYFLLTDPERLAGVSSDVREALAKDNLVALKLAGGGLLFMGCGSLLSLAAQFVILHIELDMLRYTLTDEALRLRRGVVNVEEVTLSFANIQNVKFNQGPVQRYFGIGDLIVEVAGGGGGIQAQQAGGQPQLNHQGLIKGISHPERLRDTIQARVRRFRGSGIGGPVQDARAQVEEESDAGALDSPEARALLAEIRDALAATRLVSA